MSWKFRFSGLRRWDFLGHAFVLRGLNFIQDKLPCERIRKSPLKALFHAPSSGTVLQRQVKGSQLFFLLLLQKWNIVERGCPERSRITSAVGGFVSGDGLSRIERLVIDGCLLQPGSPRDAGCTHNPVLSHRSTLLSPVAYIDLSPEKPLHKTRGDP